MEVAVILYFALWLTLNAEHLKLTNGNISEFTNIILYICIHFSILTLERVYCKS